MINQTINVFRSVRMRSGHDYGGGGCSWRDLVARRVVMIRGISDCETLGDGKQIEIFGCGCRSGIFRLIIIIFVRYSIIYSCRLGTSNV